VVSLRGVLASWRGTALDWAAAELRGAVRALQPVPPPDGTGVAGYQLADYLDQHGRRTRQDQPGPASLWDALISPATTATDLDRLAHEPAPQLSGTVSTVRNAAARAAGR
jgi:hypothetical protein